MVFSSHAHHAHHDDAHAVATYRELPMCVETETEPTPWMETWRQQDDAFQTERAQLSFEKSKPQ
jgi:hypothetical protein